MKYIAALLFAALMLFSGCKTAETASVSMPTESQSTVPELPISSKIPEPEPSQTEETTSLAEPYSSDCTDMQRLFDPNSGMEACLFPDGSVSITFEGDTWTVESANIVFDRLEWNCCGHLLFMDGETTAAIYHPIVRAFSCTGVPLIKNE